MDMSFNRIPKQKHQPLESVRSRLRTVAMEMLAAGERISFDGLRARGVRGSTQRIRALRLELVAAGELPPEAGPRTYVQRAAENGKASLPPPPPPPTPKVAVSKSARQTRTWLRMYGIERLRRQYRKKDAS